MSPLSDTTNLAPAVAGTDLFQHIRAMVWTTGPTYVIVAAITLVIGFRYAGGELDTAKIAAIQALMDAEFWINPVTLLAPVVVIGLSAARKPALPSLWAGIFVAIIIAAINGTGFGDILNIMQYYSPQFSLIAGAGEDAAVWLKFLPRISLSPRILLWKQRTT